VAVSLLDQPLHLPHLVRFARPQGHLADVVQQGRGIETPFVGIAASRRESAGVERRMGRAAVTGDQAAPGRALQAIFQAGQGAAGLFDPGHPQQRQRQRDLAHGLPGGVRQLVEKANDVQTEPGVPRNHLGEALMVDAALIEQIPHLRQGTAQDRQGLIGEAVDPLMRGMCHVEARGFRSSGDSFVCIGRSTPFFIPDPDPPASRNRGAGSRQKGQWDVSAIRAQ